jgi:hypothetical protein
LLLFWLLALISGASGGGHPPQIGLLLACVHKLHQQESNTNPDPTNDGLLLLKEGGSEGRTGGGGRAKKGEKIKRK